MQRVQSAWRAVREQGTDNGTKTDVGTVSTSLGVFGANYSLMNRGVGDKGIRHEVPVDIIS